MKKIITCSLLASLLTFSACSEKEPPKEKLKIVFLMGQSNMVGLADMATARYMLEPVYVPPKELVTQKSEYFEWSNLFWQGARTFKGAQEYKDQLDELVEARSLSRMKWRQRVRGEHGPWQAEWGPKPEGTGRSVMYEFLDKKAAEEGIYGKIEEILEGPHNSFTVEVAFQELLGREAEIADEVEMIRKYYLGDATLADFDAFDAAIKEAGMNKNPNENFETWRNTYAQMAKEHFNLPTSDRVHIVAHGHVSGEGEKNRYTTQGPLTVGFGGQTRTIGPEYGVGMALERLVDGPILLVKCSWGNTALGGAWRPPTLDGIETPAEKANREMWNVKLAEQAKAQGRDFTPKGPPEKKGELAYCWDMTLPQIERVLADPGKYHPDYDPEQGYEIAGMVWFQGYSDQGNPAYGELLVELIKFVRDKYNAPDMPFVAGTLGMPAYKHMALSGDVNGGMVQAAQAPDLRGTVDVVNTAPYFPLEFEMAHTVRQVAEKGSPEQKAAEEILKRATSNKGFHYHGSAKCFLLMGDAMGRSLANLMEGGEPAILNKLE